MTTQPHIADDTPDGDPTLHGANEPTITPDPVRRERQADPADRAGDHVGHYKLLSKLVKLPRYAEHTKVSVCLVNHYEVKI